MNETECQKKLAAEKQRADECERRYKALEGDENQSLNSNRSDFKLSSKKKQNALPKNIITPSPASNVEAVENAVDVLATFFGI